MFGPSWKEKLGQLKKSHLPNHVKGMALKICREVFSNITGFKFSYTNHFRNPKNKEPHRIIVKVNIVDDMPTADYQFKCYRDEFLFKPKAGDWLVFICMKSDFSTCYILGKYYLIEFMPDLLASEGREYLFNSCFMIPVEFNMDQIQYRKGRRKSHSVLHGMLIHQ